MRRCSAILCLVLILAPAAPAQTRSGSASINVNLVEIPVYVTRNGEPVRGLTAANFEVIDGGERRNVTHFDVVDYGTPGLASGQEVPGPSARRRFMLLFDMNHSSPASLTRAREAATAFVQKQILPSDLLCIASISSQAGAQLLTSFTTDRNFALAAIKGLGGQYRFEGTDPLLLTAIEMDRIAESVQGPRAEEVSEHYHTMAANMRIRSNDEKKNAIQRELSQFSELGMLLDRVKGRKQVVLLSEGFDPKMLAGRGDLRSDEAGREQAAAERGQLWAVDTDARYGSTEAAGSLKSMINTLRRSDVVLHAIDVKGVRTDVDANQGLNRVSNEALSLLTHDTGGTVFKNSNNLGEEFGRMLKAQEVTYVLAFQAPARNPGKFRDLKVRLVNVPDARIAHRPGYYESSDAINALDRALTAGEIVMNRLVAEDVKVNTLATAFPGADGKSDVPVIVEIDGPSLLAIPAPKGAGAEVFIYAFNKEGAIRDYVYQRMSFDLGKLRAKLMGRGVKFYHTLRLDPGDYSIRTLVRSAGGRNGFRETSLHVPMARESFAVAPLVWDEGGGWVMVKAPDRVGAGPYPFMAGETMFVPSAMPVLSAGGTSEVALIAYNLASHIDMDAQVNANGASQPIPLTIVGRTQPQADGRVTYVINLKPAQLQRGDYTLVMNLREKGSAAARSVSIPVQVQ